MHQLELIGQGDKVQATCPCGFSTPFGLMGQVVTIWQKHLRDA